jgi:hypothetical protein
MQQIVDSLTEALGGSLINVLGALAILVAGWILAVVIRAVIRRGLGMVKLNLRLQKGTGEKWDVEGGVARGVFYLVLVMAFIAFFNVLDLQQVAAPLQSLVDTFLAFLPNLIAAAVLMLLAWFLAILARKGLTGLLARTNLDEKVATAAGMRPLSENLGHVLHALVLLLFLPIVLGTLEMDGLLEPVQAMVGQILGMLPNMIAAGVLAGVGWFVAGLLRSLVTNLLAASGADNLGARAGLKGTTKLSGLVGLVVFIFVFIPALIAALNTLRIEAISRPAVNMLGVFMDAIPKLFAAGVILAISFFVANLVRDLVANLLGGVGFDRLPDRLGVGGVVPDGQSPSRLAGQIAAFFILLFAVVEAASVVGFSKVSGIVAMLIDFGGQVLLGVAIIAVGMWIANLAHGAIARLGRPNAAFFAGLARIAILGVVFAMGLRAMDIAENIVNLAFGFTIGAVAVAVALSFGLGGREAAGKQMEHLLARMRGE